MGLNHLCRRSLRSFKCWDIVKWHVCSGGVMLWYECKTVFFLFFFIKLSSTSWNIEILFKQNNVVGVNMKQIYCAVCGCRNVLYFKQHMALDRICMNRLVFNIVASVMAACPDGSERAARCLTWNPTRGALCTAVQLHLSSHSVNTSNEHMKWAVQSHLCAMGPVALPAGGAILWNSHLL